MALAMELETRPCKQCLREFRCLTTSKQEFCNRFCDLEYVKKPGLEKIWEEKLKKLKAEGNKPITNTRTEKHQAQALMDAKKFRDNLQKSNEKKSELSGAQNIKRDDSITTHLKCVSTEMIQSGEPRKISAEPRIKESEPTVIQSSEKSKDSTNENGTREINPSTRSAQKLTEGKEIQLSESRPQSTRVEEAIWSQQNYIDRCAGHLMSNIERLSHSKKGMETDVVLREPTFDDLGMMIASCKTLNELMKTRMDAIKLLHEIKKDER